jgi:hypothetical protein
MMLLIIMMNVNGWMDRLFSELETDLGEDLVGFFFFFLMTRVVVVILCLKARPELGLYYYYTDRGFSCPKGCDYRSAKE